MIKSVTEEMPWVGVNAVFNNYPSRSCGRLFDLSSGNRPPRGTRYTDPKS
jgi:hypothetical protein